MNLQYETIEVCEFKLMGAFDHWMNNPGLSAAQVGESFDIHPKYLWQEYARYKNKIVKK